MKKKLLAILLSAFMVMTSFTVNVFAISGTGTSHSQWKIGKVHPTDVNAYIDGSTLKITGSGEMLDFDSSAGNEAPWKNKANMISTIDISSSVTNIGLEAFSGLSRITSFEISKKVTSIGENAFAGCTKLADVEVNATNFPTLGNGAFDNCADSLKIRVPFVSLEAYKTASNWSNYQNKIEGFYTIANILALYSNFPKAATSDNTPPNNAWTNGNAKMYITNDNAKLRYGNGQSDLSNAVTENNGNYECVVGTNKQKYTFVIESNKLTAITINGHTTPTYDGTYIPPATKIADILPSDFPDSLTSGWTNGTYSLYASSGNLTHSNGKSIPTSTVLTLLDNGNYQYVETDSLINLTYTFEMNGDDLQKIIISGDEGFNGEYVAPVTVGYILSTVDGGFPNSSDAGWVNGNGERVYINNNTINFSTSISLEAVVQKDDNNKDYKCSVSPVNCKFIMTSEVLTSIEVSGAIISSYNGEYVPYKYNNDPISIPVGYSGDDVEFVTNATYVNDTDVSVYIDSNTVPLTLNTDYTLSPGSTHVKLKGSYVSTLSVGTHKMTIRVSGYSSIDQDFTITEVPTPTPDPDPTPGYIIPKTGVEGTTTTNNHSLLKLSSLSLLSIGTYLVIKKKKDN